MTMLGIFPQKSTASINDLWERSGTRVYLAAFTINDNEVDVRKHCGFTPQMPHPSDAGSLVVQIDVEQNAELAKYANAEGLGDGFAGLDCFWWAITITYGPVDPLTHSPTGSPVDQPIDVSFQWQVFEQPCDVAYNPGTGALVPVLNSAGIPFDPGVEREQLKGVMRVAWNSLTFDPATFFAIGNQINSDVWNGFPIGSVKFSPPNMPQRLYSQFLGQNYYRLEAEFCFNPNDGGWNARPIDRSFVALDGSGAYYKILDINGQPLSQPARLDGSGHVLPASSTSFNQFDFQIYASTDFATAFPNLTTLF